MEKSKIIMQLIAGFAVGMSTMSAGFHTAWPSPALPKLLAKDSNIDITSDQGSWIVSAHSLGTGIGPFVSALLFDRYGRKKCLLLVVIPQILSPILIGLAQSFWWFVIARIFAGIGAGMTYLVAPMYLGEIADDKIRGALGTMLSSLMSLAILLTYCIGPWVNGVTLAGFGIVFPALFGLMLIWVPESPYFLIMKNKPDEAEKSLKRLRGTESVSEELNKVKKNVEFDQKNTGTFRDLIMTPGNRKALTITVGLILAQQCSGISAVLSYIGQIFEASGSTIDSKLSVIIIGVIQLICGVTTAFLVDLAGRRSLLLFSAGGSILFLGGEAMYFQLQSMGTDLSMISWLPITAIIGYIICYTVGFGALPIVVLSEIFPCNVKSLAALVTSVAGASGGLVITKIYQIVADAYGIHYSFWIFVIITIFSGIFIYFALPETKQRSLRSIQDELHKTTESKAELTKSELA